MEALHASLPQPQLLHSAADAAERILLLDCDHQRRKLRAEALVNRGVLVDQAAESVTAKTLWRPGIYDLVLVELRGADAGCTAFIAFVQGGCSRQKFGFYLVRPPYLTASAEQCRTTLQKHTTQKGVVQYRSEGPVSRHDGTRLLVATKGIAAARQLARRQAQTQQERGMQVLREGNLKGIPASDPLTLAQRVLGGASKP